MHAVMGPLPRALGMSCRDITTLSAVKLDRKLTLGEAVKLRMHTLMCAVCRPLPRQFANLRELVRHSHDEPPSDLDGGRREIPRQCTRLTLMMNHLPISMAAPNSPPRRRRELPPRFPPRPTTGPEHPRINVSP
jgi:hypothetical protein